MKWLVPALALAVTAGLTQVQTPHAIVAPDAELEILGEHFGLTDGTRTLLADRIRGNVSADQMMWW